MSTTRSVHIGGVQVPVRTVGSGPPVLFIHGLYVNDHLWDGVADRVAPARTCYLPTLPLGAHSTPGGPDWRPTLKDLIGLITGLIEELDLHDVTVVGNDTGGGLVLLALGSEHPALARITRVVLTNCDSYDHFPPPGFAPLVAMARYAPPLAKATLWLLLATRPGQELVLRTVTRRGDRPDTLFNPAQLDEAIRVTAALRLSEKQQQMHWLQDLDVPVHLVWGEDDVFFPSGDAERLRTAIPGAGITMVPRARTYVPLDEPDAVTAAIMAA